MEISCNGTHPGMQQLLTSLLALLIAASALASLAAAATSSSTPTLSWSSQLSITIDAGNGSAIVKGSALVSPDHKSWAFGVVVGTNTTDGVIPVAFGIFKAVDTSSPVPTWGWKPLSSSQIASATVSFEPGAELVLLVKWRNSSSSGSSVAWSSDTGGEAQAVALTNTGQLLLLDANNQTIWQRPGEAEAPGPASASAPLSPCPANICLLPPPPSSSPPGPPSPPRSPSPSTATRATFHAPLLLIFLLLSLL
ncbi:hypothetical protein L7F22_016926 [Adiantum nelumboides]|nr:hypothetical protein [Adiantum nelumboides]